jgi:acyl-coenzyme A thioesterase PaaI-like protein
VRSPERLTGSVERRVRTSVAAQTMLATLGASIVEVDRGRVVLEMPGDPASASSSAAPTPAP